MRYYKPGSPTSHALRMENERLKRTIANLRGEHGYQSLAMDDLRTKVMALTIERDGIVKNHLALKEEYDKLKSGGPSSWTKEAGGWYSLEKWSVHRDDQDYTTFILRHRDIPARHASYVIYDNSDHKMGVKSRNFSDAAMVNEYEYAFDSFREWYLEQEPDFTGAMVTLHGDDGEARTAFRVAVSEAKSKTPWLVSDGELMSWDDMLGKYAQDGFSVTRMGVK